MAFVRRRLASESAATLRPNLFLVRDIHLAIGTGSIRCQLSLEKQLFEACQSLLPFYQENEDWAAVGQIALTLASNKERIYKLQQQIAFTEQGKEMEPDNRASDEGADLALAVRVRQVVNQDSDNIYFCVEAESTPHGAKQVLHTLEEFKALQSEMEAKGLLVNEFETLRGECQQLSYMLSTMLADPVLCRDPIFLQFMAGNTSPSLSSGKVCMCLDVYMWGRGGR